MIEFGLKTFNKINKYVLRGDQMIDTIMGITSYLGVTSAKNFAGVCPYKDNSL